MRQYGFPGARGRVPLDGLVISADSLRSEPYVPIPQRLGLGGRAHRRTLRLGAHFGRARLTGEV
jgi:hypothetical protein